MLGDTLTVTLDGSGGTDVVTSKINDSEPYTGEYLKKRSLDEVRIKVRHFTESPQKDGRVLTRHIMTVTQYVYPTESIPMGLYREVSFTIRNQESDSIVDVTDLGEALALYLTDVNLDKLFGWES